MYQVMKQSGPDVAMAHFAVNLGGAAKFAGLSTWFDAKEGNQSQIPQYAVRSLHLEAIDCSNTDLLYESLDCFGRFLAICIEN